MTSQAAYYNHLSYHVVQYSIFPPLIECFDRVSAIIHSIATTFALYSTTSVPIAIRTLIPLYTRYTRSAEKLVQKNRR